MESDQAKYYGSGSGKILWNRIRQSIMDPDQKKIMESDQAKYYGSGTGKILWNQIRQTCIEEEIVLFLVVFCFCSISWDGKISGMNI